VVLYSYAALPPHSLDLSQRDEILPGNALDDQAPALVFSPQSTSSHRAIGESKRGGYIQAQRRVCSDIVDP
jgi:hypothetical protein